MKRQAGALVVLLVARAAVAQFGQQGGKLVGSGAVGPAYQGWSVALSADGNTALVGAPADTSGAGAAWVFRRNAGVWSQEGARLVGTGAVGPAKQGTAVAISADGSNAVIGGLADDGYAGAAWVFTYSGGMWTQQGAKLVGAGAIGPARQGTSVAISALGDTVVVGGPGDSPVAPPESDAAAGASWVFTRSGSVWSQEGGKLVGSDVIGAARQGTSVAISGDGTTAIVGGPWDGSGAGAVWVFTRGAGGWSQQGGKLVGTGAVGRALQGRSVAISADGATAIIGGPNDAPAGVLDWVVTVGAAWVFTRTGAAWSQQGGTLVGTSPGHPYAAQGTSVAISADGATAVVGGPGYVFPTNGAWVFTRAAGRWLQQGGMLAGTDAFGHAAQGTAVAISGDATTIMAGGPYDNSGTGAAWVFTLPGFTAWIPVAAHNPGLLGSQWRTDLGLLNPGSSTAGVQLRYHGPAGVVTNTTYVPPGTQSVLADVVGQLGASGQGALEVLSDQLLKVTSRTYNQVAPDATCDPGGTHGQDYPVLLAKDGLGSGESAYLAGLVENASYRSNIGLVNAGTEPATVLVKLYDGAGSKLDQYTVELVPGQWVQDVQPFRNLAGQTAMDRGYAVVTVQAGWGVFGVASVVDNLTNDPTTVAMQR